jgi:hypothetical protein
VVIVMYISYLSHPSPATFIVAESSVFVCWNHCCKGRALVVETSETTTLDPVPKSNNQTNLHLRGTDARAIGNHIGNAPC